MDTLVLLLLSSIVITIVFNIFSELKRYKSFVSKIQIGTRLTRHVKLLDDEFDPGQTFIITIVKLGDKQVQVKFTDGSITTMYKSSLYEEHWKIIDETK